MGFIFIGFTIFNFNKVQATDVQGYVIDKYYCTMESFAAPTPVEYHILYYIDDDIPKYDLKVSKDIYDDISLGSKQLFSMSKMKIPFKEEDNIVKLIPR